jgi:hypothetical protein
MSMRYQIAAADRDAAIADKLSELAGAAAMDTAARAALAVSK